MDLFEVDGGYLHFCLDVLVIRLVKILEENIWLIGIIFVRNQFSYTKLFISCNDHCPLVGPPGESNSFEFHLNIMVIWLMTPFLLLGTSQG